MAVERDAELGAVALELLDLGGGLLVEDRQAARSWVGIEWSAVATVWSGRRTVRPRSRRPVNACGLVTSWTRWRSIARTVGRARLLGDDVVVPDLLDERARVGHGGGARAAVRGSKGTSAGAVGRSPADGEVRSRRYVRVAVRRRHRTYERSLRWRPLGGRCRTERQMLDADRDARPAGSDARHRATRAGAPGARQAAAPRAARCGSAQPRSWRRPRRSSTSAFLAASRRCRPPVTIPWPLIAVAFFAGRAQGRRRPLPARDPLVLAERVPGGHRVLPAVADRLLPRPPRRVRRGALVQSTPAAAQGRLQPRQLRVRRGGRADRLLAIADARRRRPTPIDWLAAFAATLVGAVISAVTIATVIIAVRAARRSSRSCPR